MQQISTRVVSELQNRLNQAKEEWRKRLADYVTRSVGTASSGQELIQRPLTAFRVLLQLFAYEDVLSNGRLDAVYDQDNGATLMNFVPQLLSFLLHGANSTDLEEWILNACRHNIYFAHRCYWFLRAWSLESQKTSNGVPARLSSFSSLASFDDVDKQVPQNGEEKTPGNLLPEERAVIEELLHHVMKCGEEPARRLYFGNGMGSEDDRNSTSSGVGGQSPSALMFAAESGAIPYDPKTGTPSAKHWECLAATRRHGFLPLDGSLTSLRGRNSERSDKSFFDATPVFFDALLTVAENLFTVPREDRKTEFHRQLQLLEVQALPSNAIYVPVQDVNHRVWRIVADESIAISTKERVPCIVCLEVVEYPLEEIPQARDVRHLLTRVLPQDSQINFPDIATPLSEKEMIRRWRFEYRDPHRRDTAFEKIASQMRESMKKIHLDHVKTSVKAHIHKVKNTTLQDFLALSVPGTFEEGENEDYVAEPLDPKDPIAFTDIERGDSIDGSGTPSKTGLELSSTVSSGFSVSPPASPSPSKKIARMGQWTPPTKLSADREGLSRSLDDLLVPRISHGSYQRNEEPETTQEEKRKGRFDCLPRSSKKTPGDENAPNGKPPTKPPPVVFRENWKEKEGRIRTLSAFGWHPSWKLLPILIKANDDLRQEQLASQLIYRMTAILAREKVPVWLCPYEILALTESGGIIEAIPDTISISSLKKNDPNYSSLKGFFHSFFEGTDSLADAKANFCESLAGYSMVCFLLQMKDRHNGNILLDNKGHLIHIDFGFFFLSSPGKNSNFESAPFKLTREFVDVLDGPDSRLFRVFRMLCYRAFIALRRHCMEIILLIEMLKQGNEYLPCFRGRPDDAINELRHRFRLDLNDRACLEYVNALIDESLENWRTNWYDRYQRYCVGVL
jgi:phosphatidylinositol 4-kinase